MVWFCVAKKNKRGKSTRGGSRAHENRPVVASVTQIDCGGQKHGRGHNKAEARADIGDCLVNGGRLRN
ncbi:hypothetical protein IB61_02235 [Brucella abortus LMN2]|nr:hypothetical protein IB61_02235 [Brucella abortus LMN2]